MSARPRTQDSSSMPARHNHHSSRRRPARGRGSRAAPGRRRLAVLGVLLGAVLLVAWLVPRLDHAVQTLALPLQNQDIIRHQAAAKRLDPALIAAVIFAETRFTPRTSPTGAVGLMQIQPDTARFLAHLSHGYAFTTADLQTPAVNVAYGSYYLRYLLDHYHGDTMLAVAAYNGGLANVDRWVAQAHADGRSLTADTIPFPETRAYVQKVLQARQDYRSQYARQLGLS